MALKQNHHPCKGTHGQLLNKTEPQAVEQIQLCVFKLRPWCVDVWRVLLLEPRQHGCAQRSGTRPPGHTCRPARGPALSRTRFACFFYQYKPTGLAASSAASLSDGSFEACNLLIIKEAEATFEGNHVITRILRNEPLESWDGTRCFGLGKKTEDAKHGKTAIISHTDDHGLCPV